jgi:hypothetical protein
MVFPSSSSNSFGLSRWNLALEASFSDDPTQISRPSKATKRSLQLACQLERRRKAVLRLAAGERLRQFDAIEPPGVRHDDDTIPEAGDAAGVPAILRQVEGPGVAAGAGVDAKDPAGAAVDLGIGAPIAAHQHVSVLESDALGHIAVLETRGPDGARDGLLVGYRAWIEEEIVRLLPSTSPWTGSASIVATKTPAVKRVFIRSSPRGAPILAGFGTTRGNH